MSLANKLLACVARDLSTSYSQSQIVELVFDRVGCVVHSLFFCFREEGVSEMGMLERLDG